MTKKLVFYLFFLITLIHISSSHAFLPNLSDKVEKKAGMNKYKSDKNSINIIKYESSSAWGQFKEKYGNDWQVIWNDRTGTPHRVFGQKKALYGEGVDSIVRMRESLEQLNGDYFEKVSRAFISQNSGLFKMGNETLHIQRSRKHGNTWYVTFLQKYKDIPVYNSRADFQYDEEGNLRLFGVDVFSDINISGIPAISKDKAVEIVKTDANCQTGRDNILEPKLLIYPEEENDGYKYYLVWEINAKIKNPIGDWIYFIDAQDGKKRLKYNNVKYEIDGKTSGYVLPLYASDIPQEVSFPYESVYAKPDSVTVFYERKFDTSPGWKTEGLWEFDSLDGMGYYGDPMIANTGLNVYGYNVNGKYENGLDSTLYLTTSPIDCSNIIGTTLKFYRWLQIYSSNDSATIEVSNNGVDWSVIWRVSDEHPFDYSWTLKSYDISRIADGKQTVYIRWGMGPTDSFDSAGGWNIDDVQITNGLYTGISNSNGNYSIPTISGSYSLTSSLTGKYLKVDNYSDREAFFSTSVSDNISQNIIWDTGLAPSGKYDEMNVYYHAMKMHDHIKGIDPDFTGMDYCFPATVQIKGNDINNAYWNEGFGFGAGDGIESRSLALFADVIYHEYTHGITTKLYEQGGGRLVYQDGTESGAMHEGFSDYWACTLTGNTKIGLGVLINGNFLRDIDNNFVYPDDMVGQTHADGRIIAGAMWNMRKYLGQTIADRLFHFALYGLPQTFEDFLIEVLDKDDRDGDNDGLQNGTSHSAQIYPAFSVHGISGIKIKSLAIDDENFGNSNGKLNPGEKANLVVTLENKMWEGVKDVQGVLSTNDSFVTIINQYSNFGSIRERGGISDNSSNPFIITVNNSIPSNHVIFFNLNIVTQQGYSFDLTLNITANDFVSKRWAFEDISSVNEIVHTSNRILARDNNKNLHLVYGVNYLYYAVNNGIDWDVKLLDKNNLDAFMSSIALDKNNIPHIVFRDDKKQDLKYASLDNGVWKIETVDSTGDVGSYPSLAFDVDNFPNISFYADGSLNHAYYNGQNWYIETIENGTETGLYTSIVIGDDNLPRISYYDANNKILKFARYTGSKWNIDVLDNSSDIGKYPCLQMSSDGYPHISYFDFSNGDLEYIYYNGSSWNKETVDRRGNVGWYASLALDSKNYPHIAYYDSTNGDLKYAYYNGTNWGIETLDSTGDAGYYPSIVIGDNDLPKIVYYCIYPSGDNYLKFASSYLLNSPICLSPENNSLSPINVTLSWQLRNSDLTDTISYDVYLDTFGAETKIAKKIYDVEYSVSRLEYNKIYYWRIIAHNKYGDEVKGPTCIFRTVIAGDMDKNGIVDGEDLIKFAVSFGSTKGFKRYERIKDIDCNDRIDGADLMQLGINFGKNSQ